MTMKTGKHINVVQSVESDEYALEQEWQNINWHYVERSIFKLQRRIFNAEKEGDYRHWRFTLCPPKDSLYKGGIYCLSAHFPDNFPNAPPDICFNTPIYHLNVNPFAPKSFGDDKLGLILYKSFRIVGKGLFNNRINSKYF